MSARGELGWRDRAALGAGRAVLATLASTWRYSFTRGEVIAELRARQQPFVFSLWHGQLLPLLWLHRDQGVRVLISEHRDGELVARLAHTLGYDTARGSSSRGGERALLALVRALQDGQEIAVTPDGPRGPARVVQPGALVAAARAAAPIVPVTIHVRRAWHLRSWDSFTVPKPFARVQVGYGEPLWIEAESPRAAAAQTERLAAAMRVAEEGARGS